MINWHKFLANSTRKKNRFSKTFYSMNPVRSTKLFESSTDLFLSKKAQCYCIYLFVRWVSLKFGYRLWRCTRKVTQNGNKHTGSLFLRVDTKFPFFLTVIFVVSLLRDVWSLSPAEPRPINWRHRERHHQHQTNQQNTIPGGWGKR